MNDNSRNVLALASGTLAAILVMVLLITLGWVFRANHLAEEKVFAPKEESVRYEVFKYSQTFRDGANLDIAQLKSEYAQAKTDEDRKRIISLTRVKAATIPYGILNPDLDAFVQSAVNSTY